MWGNRVGGRLHHSTLPKAVNHSAVIPKGNHITELINAHYHEKVAHHGKGLDEIRSNGYWITGICRLVSSHIRQCVKCRKLRGPTEMQKMADLPPEREIHPLRSHLLWHELLWSISNETRQKGSQKLWSSVHVLLLSFDSHWGVEWLVNRCFYQQPKVFHCHTGLSTSNQMWSGYTFCRSEKWI